MSEFRQDPITQRWRVIAEGRSARPNEYVSEPDHPPTDESCPFCEGHESRTPGETAAVRTPGGAVNGPGWRVRAIPNRFPTVSSAPTSPAPSSSPAFHRRPGTGVHEVIIESPRHSPGLAYLPTEQLHEVFRFFRTRVRSLSSRSSVGGVLLFENWGPESGGTLWHPHAQIVATDVVPPRLAEEADAFRRHVRPGGSTCLLESVVAAEKAAIHRVVDSGPTYDVFAPFASEHPYEMWVVPRRHESTFADANDAEVDGLAELLPALLRSLGRVRPGASFNWYIHGLRPATGSGGDFHWHLEVAPRLLRPDGFELGAGTTVNPVAPEVAAVELRTALASDSASGGRKR